MREQLKKLSPKCLLELYKNLRFAIVTMLFYLFRLVPIRNSRIVFMNVWGFGDNAKYVAEEAIRQQISKDLIFICNHPEHYQNRKGIRFLKTNSIPAIFALATAKVWVDSNRKEAYIRKRKSQYYIQLWHGGLALKKIEGDCAKHLGERYIKRAKQDSANTNLYISNGDFCTKMYRRAFFYQGKILESGTPRMDFLLSENKSRKQAVMTELGIPKDAKVALYAPTYRDHDDSYGYQMDYVHLQEMFTKRFMGEWYIIVRLHPLVQTQSERLVFGTHVIDASAYPDFYDLLYVCDTLITDYSNCMFEGGITQKNVFLYASDLKEYKEERGFYFEYEKLPFPIAMNEEQLWDNIIHYDSEKEQNLVHEFFSKVGIKETGNASKTVVDVIKKVIK